MEEEPNLSFAIVSGVFVLVNLIGNSLVCAVILLNKSMRTPLNFLLLNLAAADILVGILAVPVHVFGSLYTHPKGISGKIFCKIVTSKVLQYICGDVSALTLAVVAYERYQAVIYPLTVREKITKLKTLVFIVITWILPLGLVFGWFFWVDLDNKTNICITKPEFEHISKVLGDFIAIFIFGFSFLPMLVLYGRVLWQLKGSKSHPIDRQQLAANRVGNRITFMLVTVTVLFAASWGSLVVLHLSNGYAYGRTSAKVSELLVVFNASVNSFLYALFSDQYKKGFNNICLRCCRSWRNVRDVHNEMKNGRPSTQDGTEMDVVQDTKL